jgi:hypothetical protein
MTDIDPDPVKRQSDARSDANLASWALKAAAVAMIWLVVVGAMLLIGWPGIWRHTWAAVP